MIKIENILSRTNKLQVAAGAFPDIEVTLTVPTSPKASLIIVPGWKSTGKRPLFNEMAKRFPSIGVATLQYDPAYCVDSTNLNIDRVNAELKALFGFATKELSPHTILFGASLGSFAIGSYLAHDTNANPAAIITRAGAPRSRKFGDPASPKTFEALVTAKCPVLIMHGDTDDVVPIAISAELHEKRTKAGLPSQFHSLPGFQHSVVANEIPTIIEYTEGFIQKVIDKR